MDNLVEQQRKHFNAISDKYFQARQHPNHLLLKELIWNNFFIRNARIAARVKRVLEPMCGMAEGYEIIKKNLGIDFDYLGFDYSESMVKIAQARKPNLTIEWNDVTVYQPAEGRFDLIILIGGLHHVYSQTSKVLENLRNALRPGGYFISFEPTHANWLTRRARKQIYRTNPIFDADSEQGFEYRDLEHYFKNTGYEKVDEVYPGLLAYVLYYNPDAFPLFNMGGKLLVKSIFAFDRLFWANMIGRKLSFATISLWRRN
jgi:SAM-dependent methyltransferase